MEHKNNHTIESNSSGNLISTGNMSKIIEEDESFIIHKNSSVNSNFYNDISNETDEPNKKYFVCNKCNSIPEILFNYDNSLNLECNCSIQKYLWLKDKDFNDNYSYNNDIEKKIICNSHHEKYKYYCTDCIADMCDECNDEEHRKHMHSLIFFDDNKIIDSLNYLSILIMKTDLNPEFANWNKRKILIETIINEYKEFPCYILFKTIISIKNYFDNLNKKNIRNAKIKDINLVRMHNNIPLIQINLSNQNINDLFFFNGLDIKNLIEINLNNNFINNIEPLLKCNFEKLEIFQLKNNLLNYQSLKDLDKMKIPNIIFINLYINKIESIKIFEKILNFKTLKRFEVGDNKFDKEEIFKNGKKKYDLSFLKTIGLTGNFTDETIHFISNLILSNLEELYVSRNNLSSLDFLKDIHCQKLFKIWAIQNNLKSYDDFLKLKFKSNIKIINLGINKIKNIDNLLEFISNFPLLEKLDISDNEFNLDCIENKSIIETIKNKYKNLELILKKKEKENFIDPLNYKI